MESMEIGYLKVWKDIEQKVLIFLNMSTDGKGGKAECTFFDEQMDEID